MSHTDDEREDDTPPTKSKPRKKLRSRWPFRLAVGGLLAAAAVWFAPSLIALTPLRQQIVPLAVPKLAARVNIGSASLGWLSSIRLNNVAIQDLKGEPLAEAPAIVLDKTLVGLLLNSSQLGTIRLDKPHVHLSLREGGSNLEDAIAPLLVGESTGATIACRVEVAGGILDLRDAAGNQGRLEELTGAVDYNPSAKNTLEAKLAARTTIPANKAGTLSVEASWQPSADPKAGALGSGGLDLKAEGVALQGLSPALSRVDGKLAVAGDFTADVHWQWSESGAVQVVDIAALDIRRLAVSASQWLGKDELRCDALQAQGKATLEQGKLLASGLQLDSDLGSVQISGGAVLEDLAKLSLLEAITRDDLRIKGRLDLAQLAKVLPATLRIREGTQITSGELDFNLASLADKGERRISARIEAAKLVAVNAGERISWDQPLVLSLAAHDSPAGPVIEKLEGQASFLRLSGQGSLADGTLSASGDLDRLANELGQFVNLDQYQLAGKLQAGLTWKRSGKDRFDATGNVLVENFQCSIPGARPWREQRLTVALVAAGVADTSGLSRLDSGSIELRSGADVLDASLTEPVTDPSLKTAWPIKGRVVGSLATWLARGQAFVPLSGWNVGGAIDATATATASMERVEVARADILLTKLQAWGNGLFIYEPELKIESSGTWDQVKGELTSKATTLAGSAVALQADNLVMHTGSTGFALSGVVDYRGDVSRLMSWTYDPQHPPTQHLFGSLTGKIKLNRESDVTRANISADLDDLVLAQRKPQAGGLLGAVTGGGGNPWEALWTEKKVTLRGVGEYDHGRDGLTLSKVDLTSQMLGLSTQGKINALTGHRRVDISGEMTYDLPGIAVFLRPYAGQDFQLAGHDTRKFFLRGPLPELNALSAAAPVGDALRGVPTEATDEAKPGVAATPVSTRPAAKPAAFPADLTGEAGLGWSSAQVQGLAIGQGELAAKLTEGAVVFQPLDLPLAEGRLRLSPRINLNANPLLLHIDRGRVLEQVRVSPEMCRTWLKYVAPLLADATRAEGKFTLDLADAELPLFNPETGTLQGSLTVHEMQVGPGALGQQVLWIGQQMKGLLERKPLGALGTESGGEYLKMPAQKVDFQLVDGRVYHKDLTFLVRDITVRTRGSVGLDQTLDLVAEVPILERWAEKDKLFAGMKGQSLQIPIRGSLSQPKLDGRIFEDLSKRLISTAAGTLLESELNKGLQKLIGPKK